MEFINQFIADYGELMVSGTWESIVMTVVPCIFGYVIGMPVGIWFHLTSPEGLKPNRVINTILGWIINIGRSIPFIILLVAMIPLTRIIMGTSLGIAGALPPLTLCVAPFIARIVEQSLAEVDASLIEAAQAFGANTFQLVVVMVRESTSSLIRGVTISLVNLFGYAAMSGAVGAGGLGSVAVRYGYNRWNTEVMVVAVILCIILVIAMQTFGDYLARITDHRKSVGGRAKKGDAATGALVRLFKNPL